VVQDSLNHLDLSESDLYFQEFFHADLSFSSLARSGLDYARFENAMLYGADLSDTHSGNVSFDGADLAFASVERCYFIRSSFSGARMEGVKGCGSRFVFCNFSNASCTHADFSDSEWREPNVTNTNFDGARFEHAVINGEDFTGSGRIEALSMPPD
jgi:BTB/POZ domain-containing protein KCTD9